jgi:DNA-binding response OmpR family regulator
VDSEHDLILCVDDEPEICDAVRALMDAFRVLTANTGAKGLALARRLPFSLSLLDYQLPDTTGLEVCRAMRAFDPYAPILLHSGRDIERAAIASGATGFIAKPLDPAVLRHRLHWHIEKQHLASLSALVAVQSVVNEGLRQRMRNASARVDKARRLIQ